jgi:iron(III) transport system substrate-binding protein
MAKAFEGKYPGIKLEAYRVSGSEMTVRLMEESKARRYIADTVETTEGNLMFMRDAFLLRPYHSPHFASYPEDAKEKGERGLYFWGIARESYIGFAYNKKLLSKNAVPKNFEGLLHPELKGRMGVSVSDPAFKVIGAMIRTKGQEFVKKLKVQEIALHTIIPPALLELIASGEVLASPGIFRNHTLNAIAKGAPVEWLPMDIADQRRRRRHRAPAAPSARALLWRIISWTGKTRPSESSNAVARRKISASNAGAQTTASPPKNTKKI